MKPKSFLRSCLLASIALLGSPLAHADIYTWTQNATGSQDWTVAGNWNAVADVGIGAGVFVSSSANELRFFATTSIQLNPTVGTQTIASVPTSLSMNTLTLNAKGPNGGAVSYVMIGDNASTWTIGNGTTSTVNLNSGTGGGHAGVDDLRYTIAPNLTLNQATTLFTGNGFNNTGYNFSGNITDSSSGYGITKSGSSRLTLSGANTYGGATLVSAGYLRLGSATALPGGIGATGGTSALTLNGGVLELASGDFKRNLGTGSDQFQITGGISGFSAVDGPRVVTVNNDASQELVWNTASFNPSKLLLNAVANAAGANNDLELTNKINLNGATRTVQVDGNTATLSGVIQGAAGLTKEGNGTLAFAGTNLYTGSTTISAGTLSVGAANNLGDSSAGLVFNGGTLQITGTSLTSLSGIGHAVTYGTNKTVGLDIDNPSNTFTADQVLNQGSGGLTKAGAGSLVLNQSNTFSGATTASGGGTLVLDYGSGHDNKKISTTTSLALSGGDLVLRGGSFAQVVSATSTAANTGNTISRDGGTATINLGAIGLGTLSTLAISEGSIAQTSSTTTNGILGVGRITVGSNFADKSGSDIVAYAGYTPYSSGPGGGSYSVVNEWTGGGTLSSSLSSYALRISNSGNSDVLNIGANNFQVPNSGTIFYAGGFDNNFTINGTGRLTTQNGNQPLVVITYTGTLTMNGILTAGGSSTFTKSGVGTLVAGGSNTYSGPTYVLQGTLLVNNTSGTGTGSGTVSVAANATLGGTGTLGGNTTIAHWGKLSFDLSTDPLTHDKLELASGKSLSFSGDSVLTITSSGTPTTGLFTLVTADGGISGSAPATVSLPVGWTADAPQIVGNDLKINITSVGGGGPGPVDHFVISSISSPQTVGTAITGITITAQDASNATATGFTGTVTFGGSGGFTGTSASFTSGELSGVSVTPTVSGSNLTFSVDDGASHTGSTTITTIQTQYEAWATGGELFDGDANGDGVKNGLAFLLGASGPNADALGKLPSVTESGGGLVMTFNCLPIAARGTATLKVAHSNTLAAWTPTVDVVPDANDALPDNNVTFVVGAGPVGPPALNTVTATIGSGAAAAGKLFGRLEAEQP